MRVVHTMFGWIILPRLLLSRVRFFVLH